MRSDQDSGSSPLYDGLEKFYRRRLASAGDEWARYRAAFSELRRVERFTVIAMRDRNDIGDAVLHLLERELDLIDLRLAAD